jgi:hypothetical protein
MREAINNNPKVQLGLLAALVLAVGLLFAPQFLQKKSDSSNTSTTSAQLSSPAGSVDLTVKSTPAAPSAGATAGSTAAVPPTSQTVSPDALIPGPGLPRPVIDAWKRGDTVVLLIVRGAGIDDRLVRSSVASLSGDSGVALFTARANRIARYSRITQGVGVSQVPALVVVRPKRVSGAVPEAQVTYGFRDSQGVVQAVHDAVYSGKDNLPYSPR